MVERPGSPSKALRSALTTVRPVAHGGRGDDEVVCAATSAGSAHGDEQVRVVQRDVLVVGQDRDRGDHFVEVCLAPRPLPCGRESDVDHELGDGDRRYRHVVVVADQVVEMLGDPVRHR